MAKGPSKAALAHDPLRPLPRAFHERDARQVARDLLGRFLVHDAPEGRTIGRIVETEAYVGPEDRAAHVHGHRRTARTEVFWGPGGHAYVYLIYGMHECFNVVTGPVDEPSAVLVRALEPVAGIDLMAKRRGRSLKAQTPKARLKALAALTAGPGRLARAMGITRAAHYGADLVAGPLRVVAGEPVPDHCVRTGPRVNIDYAGPDVDQPWRFWIDGSPFVSKP